MTIRRYGPHLERITVERARRPKSRWRERARWVVGTVLAMGALGIGIVIIIVIAVQRSEQLTNSAAPEHRAVAATAKTEKATAPRNPGVAAKPKAEGPGSTGDAPGDRKIASATPATDSGPTKQPAAVVKPPAPVERPAPPTESAVVAPRTPPLETQSPTPTQARVSDEPSRDAETPPRPPTTPPDRIRTMAAHLTAQLGREEAESTARANAEWYEADSAEFAYWQRVADTIKSTPSRPRAAR